MTALCPFPLNIDVWTKELHQDTDRGLLLDGITSFETIPDNVQLTDVDVTNYRSATDSTVQPQVERQLD